MSEAARLVSRGFLFSWRGLPSRSSSRAPRVPPSRRSARAAASSRCTRPACLRAPQTSLLDPAGQVVATRNANDLGGLLFRNVTPGDGYRVRLAANGETSGPLTVLTKQSAPPSTDVYDQTIPSDGYGYLTTRDGTKLAYSVHPPSDVVERRGQSTFPTTRPATASPSPTLIEYSGYGYAKPDGPVSGIATLANIMGFTVVDVNMRGTGCSGGAFDFFEPLQNLDGYDVIETVARQPWVAHNKVGMLGISYGGISQLFTAQTQPPSLAAITPLSVIDQTQTTLYPGGILNTGFAFNWAQERVHEAMPAGPDSGQPWAYQRIQEGDQTCADNQACTRRRRTWSPRSARTTTTCPRSPTRCPRSRSWTRSTSRSSWPASGPTSRRAGTARRSPST